VRSAPRRSDAFVRWAPAIIPTAPRSPWQNGHAERLIGSIRRECLDHLLVFGEAHLRRVLKTYAAYYNGIRPHLSLGKRRSFGDRTKFGSPRLSQFSARPIINTSGFGFWLGTGLFSPSPWHTICPDRRVWQHHPEVRQRSDRFPSQPRPTPPDDDR
jgi:hypothetical protein